MRCSTACSPEGRSTVCPRIGPQGLVALLHRPRSHPDHAASDRPADPSLARGGSARPRSGRARPPPAGYQSDHGDQRGLGACAALEQPFREVRTRAELRDGAASTTRPATANYTTIRGTTRGRLGGPAWNNLSGATWPPPSRSRVERAVASVHDPVPAMSSETSSDAAIIGAAEHPAAHAAPSGRTSCCFESSSRARS